LSMNQVKECASQLDPTVAIGARLRRLSERIDRDCARIYGELGLPFQQRWFGVLHQLAIEGRMSVGQLASNIGISHASVSETRKSLQSAGLIVSRPDPTDARSALLSLSPKGKAAFVRWMPLWLALESASKELGCEAALALTGLNELDAALDRHSLYERIKDRLDHSVEADVGAKSTLR
jgi:MarR family transcriptional regulator, organic hydroperoxide resistance regulator